MIISPSKLKTDRLLKNRTLNFETPRKSHGNLVIMATDSKEAQFEAIKGKIFRPTQLHSYYVPRIAKVKGRGLLRFSQKDLYVEAKQKTNNKIKVGKISFNAYAGKNLIYDLTSEFNANRAFAEKLYQKMALYRTLREAFDRLVTKYVNDVDYDKKYLVFPLAEHIPSLKRHVITKTFTSDAMNPTVMFLRDLMNGSLDMSLYRKFDLIIFYNPKAEVMVVMNPNLPSFDDEKKTSVLKIYRLNNFNNNEDNLSDAEDITELDLEEDDEVENIKENIKDIVLTKVAKKLKSNDLTDYEAATRDEQSIIDSIDNHIEEYLTKPENVDKTFEELVKDVEEDKDVKLKSLRYIETKKINQNKLAQMSKNLDKEIEVIESIDDIVVSDEINEADIFEVEVPMLDESITKSRLSSIDEQYNKKQAKTDLIEAITSFSDSTYSPLTVDELEIKDGSDDFNAVNTLKVKYKTDEGKTLSFTVDIPKIVDKRNLYLGGNKKELVKQIMRLPIVKTKPDRAEITTSFNKITIERTSGKLSRKNVYLLKIFDEIEKMGSNIITITRGSNNIDNSTFHNDFEYEDISSDITAITTPKYDLLFNRKEMSDILDTLDVKDDFQKNKTPLGFSKKMSEGELIYEDVIYIQKHKIFSYNLNNKKTTDLNKDMFEFIVKDVLNRGGTKLPTIGKSFMYTKMKFLMQTYPVFTVIASLEGISNILKRYKVEYKVSKTKQPFDQNYIEVKFKDLYLYYKDELKNTLLLNALYLMNTEEYNFLDFDTDTPYTDFFTSKFGPALGIHVRNMLRINLGVMVDPITREILKDLRQPSNIVDMLLMTNTLLTSNSYRTLNDMSNYRIRSNEIIYAMLYKIVADAYTSYQRHKINGRPINLNIPQNKLVTDMLTLQTVNDHSTLNPVLEMENIASATAKGFRGVNLNSAFTLEMRAYDESMSGIISGNATPFSGSAGITRSLSYDPMINHIRGYIPEIDKDKLDATNILSPTELLSAYTSVSADPPRQAMQVSQTKHTMPVHKTDKQLLGSGLNKTMAFMLSDDFCFKAKEDGFIEKIDKDNLIAILSYKSGKKDAIDLNETLSKNSNSGFYINQQFLMAYTEGEKFQKDDVIAYNPAYFTGKGKNVDYKPGTLAKIAVTPGDFSFEDSTLIASKLGDKCASNITMLTDVALGPNAVIHNIVNKNDQIKTGDPLVDFTPSFDDPATSEFLQTLAAQMGDEDLSNVTQDVVKSKYSGRVVDIRIYYNVDFNKLSPSLQKLINKYKRFVEKKKASLEGLMTSNVRINPVEKVKQNKVGQKNFEGVLIQFYIEYPDTMGLGDKLTFNTALKAIISNVIDDEEAPISEYRQDEIIEAIMTPTGIISRMTADIYSQMYSNKVLIEVGKKIKEIVEE